MNNPAASDFIKELHNLQSDKEAEKIRRYFKADDSGNRVIGVRMKSVFDLAREYRDMPIPEIENLLESPYYEGRMGAVSIMDFRVRPKSVTQEHRKQLFELYLNRHDRINSWDFVDRAAPRVVGGYLLDKPRDILYQLARSDNRWERRTSIVSTLFFIRNGDVDDTFALAEILRDDQEEYMQKAVGACLREAGKRHEDRLYGFLEKYASDMPRAMLTRAVEKMEKKQKAYFRSK